MKNKIISRIEYWGKVTPDKTAVVTADGRHISYKKLVKNAKYIASLIYKEDLHRTGYIGVFLSQCYELPICLLAIWMAGAAYVPIDPIYPFKRVNEIINEIDLSCVLTNNCCESFLKGNELSIDYINVEERSICTRNEKKLHNLELKFENFKKPFSSTYHLLTPNSSVSVEDDLAYVIFTSGSTGKPKGIKTTFTGLFNVLQTFARELNLSDKDSLLSTTRISFDIFGLELFLPLICGATCYFTDSLKMLDGTQILSNLEKHNITIFQGVPSIYQLLVEEKWPKFSLRHLLCGGESWEANLALNILREKPSECTLWNVYGPTETTIWSSLYRVFAKNDIYLSPSVDNTFFYVLDENLELAQEGELHIAGAGLASGYYKNASLTKDRFIENSYNSVFTKLYRTGDIVRCIGKKKFQFVGRKDQQVKIRGYRVELGEIESVLLKHPKISRVVVVYDYLSHPDEKSLVACIQAKENDIRNYRTFLSKYLPVYMIPQHFVKFAHFPLTSNLKIDRRKILDQLKDPFTGLLQG